MGPTLATSYGSLFNALLGVGKSTESYGSLLGAHLGVRVPHTSSTSVDGVIFLSEGLQLRAACCVLLLVSMHVVRRLSKVGDT